MGMRATAFASMDLLLEELKGSLVAKEKELMAMQPRGGVTIKRIVDDYGVRLRQMADRCAQQRKWVANEGAFPNLIGNQAWVDKSLQCMEDLHQAMLSRVTPVCSTTATNSLEVRQAMIDLLKAEYDAIVKRLELNLRAQRDEVKNDAGKKLLTFFRYLFTAAVGFVLALLVEHLKKP